MIRPRLWLGFKAYVSKLNAIFLTMFNSKCFDTIEVLYLEKEKNKTFF